jgi:competence protein ComEA
VLLLAGTTLPSLTQSGPAFPPIRVSPPARTGDAGDPVDRGRSAAVGTAPAREAVRTLGERGIPAPPEPLDINRADAPGLQALPGVGPELARRIVAHRESHGLFRKPEDLLRVSGIGAQRYARLRGLVRTAEAP